MLGLALAIDEAAVRRGGGAAAPMMPAGAEPTGFAALPSVHLHPHSQAAAATRDGAGRITACPDRRGLAAASQPVAGAGPRQLTDPLGRVFWRFEGSEYLNLATALAADTRGCAVFLVGRIHRGGGTTNILGLGNAAAGTAVNTGGTVINVAGVGGSAPFVRGGGRSAALDAANAARVIAGSQLQVIGVVSRTTGNGDQRLYLNTEAAGVPQVSTAATGVQGAEIGRSPFAPGAAGSWGCFDLYEIAVWAGTLTNAQADAAAAALVANWRIVPVVNQLVVEGDSITQGIGTVASGSSLGVLLGEPGGVAGVPEGWRVINNGVSGSTPASLLTRRDIADTLFGKTLAGRNVVVSQIGRNSLTGDAASWSAVYADIVALNHTAGSGYLERGWEVRQAINIAVSSSLAAANEGLRAALRAPAFLTDCAAEAGQAHAGRLGRVDLPLVTVAGSGTIFDSVADSQDAAWFQGDATHPTAAATLEMARAYRAAL